MFAFFHSFFLPLLMPASVYLSFFVYEYELFCTGEKEKWRSVFIFLSSLLLTSRFPSLFFAFFLFMSSLLPLPYKRLISKSLTSCITNNVLFKPKGWIQNYTQIRGETNKQTNKTSCPYWWISPDIALIDFFFFFFGRCCFASG